jgi:hypothetical protein
MAGDKEKGRPGEGQPFDASAATLARGFLEAAAILAHHVQHRQHSPEVVGSSLEPSWHGTTPPARSVIRTEDRSGAAGPTDGIPRSQPIEGDGSIPPRSLPLVNHGHERKHRRGASATRRRRDRPVNGRTTHRTHGGSFDGSGQSQFGRGVESRRHVHASGFEEIIGV